MDDRELAGRLERIENKLDFLVSLEEEITEEEENEEEEQPNVRKKVVEQ